LLEHAVLAKARVGTFMNWKILHGLAPAMGAQRQAKGGRAFALAVAGVDDDDAAALALGLVVGFLRWVGFQFAWWLDSGFVQFNFGSAIH
jgi:hypothetical protein